MSYRKRLVHIRVMYTYLLYIIVAYGFFFFGQATNCRTSLATICSVVISCKYVQLTSRQWQWHRTVGESRVFHSSFHSTFGSTGIIQYAYFHSIIWEDSNISLSVRACQKSHCNHTTNRLRFKVAAPLHLIKSFISKRDKFVPIFQQFTSIFIIFRFRDWHFTS